MARPVTLFTGQWADLPLEVLAKKAAGWGYDGVELACWGDHFEIDKALKDDGYCKAKRAMLDKLGLKVFAISCVPVWCWRWIRVILRPGWAAAASKTPLP